MMIIQLFLLTLVSGVHPQTFRDIHIQTGEIVALFCESKHSDAEILWKMDDSESMTLYNNMSSAQRWQIGVVLHRKSLVILSASVNHQGKYACSVGNSSQWSWFRLTVHTHFREQDSRTCYTPASCLLCCNPAHFYENFCNGSIITTWHKGPKDGHFSSVKTEHSGIYTCTRSCPYRGQMYNVTFEVRLDVQQSNNQKTAYIQKPRQTTFEVELGSPKVIDCEALTRSCNNSELHWLSNGSFVNTDSTLRVFYNDTCDKNNKMTASLVFTKVLEEDLSKNYTCKLEDFGQTSSDVTITLTQKARPSHISLVRCTVVLTVLSAVMVFICVKFKIEISLFLRDTLGCHSSTSDGKSYDAFLMCYESDTDGGFNARDRKMLESVLEERFGYSLCLYDRDVLPGRAVAQVVLDCIEQSRAVVLVPTSSDPGLGSGLLSAIHEALVERQTRLVFINTEKPEVSRSGSLPKALQLLSESGNHVAWKGMSSMPPSSSFWKQLRYHLPAPQRAPKIQLLPQTV